MPSPRTRLRHTRIRSHFLSWRGQPFHFVYVPPSEPGTGAPAWAVSRRELIGMMPCSDEVTTKEFDVQCARWLGDLLNTRSSDKTGGLRDEDAI